jgi:hypothetical protein
MLNCIRGSTRRAVLLVANGGVSILSLAVFACSSAPGGPTAAMNDVGAVKVSATVQQINAAPTSYAVSAVFTNTGSANVRFDTFKDCAVRLRAYSNPDHVGAPVWDETASSGCAFVALQVQLAPGESRTLTRTMAALPLTSGTYYLSALVVVGNSSRTIDAGNLVIQ